MKQNINKFLAGFIIFPGLWNMISPATTPLPTPSRGEEELLRAVLTQARFDESGASLPLAEDREPRKTIWVLATAYTSSVDETDDTPFVTASGTITRPGTVAANFMYFGSRVRLPEYFGNFTFTIEDRMNERYGENRIDIWMPTKTQARAWGARWVKMEVY